jgi:hypothetical protein
MPRKIQPVPAFLFVSGVVDNARVWDIDDLDELCTCELTTPTRPDIVGIAGSPQRINPKGLGHWNQKPERTSRVSVSTVRRVDCEACVPSVQLDVRIGPSTEIDAAKFFSGMSLNHAEMISENLVNGVWPAIEEFQYEISVLKRPGSEGSVVIRFRHPVSLGAENSLQPPLNRTYHGQSFGSN